jgi:hypothetical protein
VDLGGDERHEPGDRGDGGDVGWSFASVPERGEAPDQEAGGEGERDDEGQFGDDAPARPAQVRDTETFHAERVNLEPADVA